ncbi:unnamed protein product, partial [Laminaria digitata]
PDDINHTLGGFWYDKVVYQFFCKRSQKAISEAERKGCPVDVLREVFKRHDYILDENARTRLRNLPQEYKVWKSEVHKGRKSVRLASK